MTNRDSGTAQACEITVDGWCASHSTGAGPTYCDLKGWGRDGIFRAALESLLAAPRQGPHDDSAKVLHSWLARTSR